MAYVYILVENLYLNSGDNRSAKIAVTNSNKTVSADMFFEFLFTFLNSWANNTANTK